MKKKRIVISVVLGMLLLAGFGVYQHPAVKMLQGISKVKKEVERYRNPVLEELELVKLYQNRQDECYHDQISCSIKLPQIESDSKLLDGFALDTISVNLENYYDNQQKRIQGTMNAGIGSFSLAEGKMTVLDDLAYFFMPELLEDAYYVNLETLGNDFNQSAFAEMTGMQMPQDFGFSPFTNGSGKDWEEFSQVVSQIAKHAAQLRSYVRLENTSEIMEIERNGETVKTKAVRLTVKEHAIQDMVNYASHVIKASSLYKNQLKEIIPDLEIEAPSGDLSLLFFLDSRRTILAVKTESAITCKKGDMTALIQAAGTKNSYDGFHVEIGKKTGQQDAQYTLDQTMKEEGSVRKTEMILTRNQETVLVYQDAWDWNNKSVQLKSRLGETTAVDMKAEIQNIVSGESFDLYIADLSYKNGDETMEMAIKLSQKPASDSMTEWTEQVSNAKELFSLSKVDLFKLACEIMKAVGVSLLPF